MLLDDESRRTGILSIAGGAGGLRRAAKVALAAVAAELIAGHPPLIVARATRTSCSAGAHAK